MSEPDAAPECLRVGEFEVNLRCGELRRNGNKIRLQERPFRILAALLERPGGVVTREEIQQKLWPTDTFVDFEHSINTAVNKLRKALGDDAESPRFIETLPRYGYRLIAPVSVVESPGSRPEAGLRLALPRQESPGETSHKNRRRVAATAGLLAGLLATACLIFVFFPFPLRRASSPSHGEWVQITHFPDGATQPALSPDGRMLAFIRGPETFVTPGQIYVKILPDGQPVQLTHDDLPKMAPAFSPDGSRIAYTATARGSGGNNWGNTWVVPVLGGEPQQLLPNAAALTWADKQHVVFSEIKTGYLMGIATAGESRAGERDVYLPAGSGMAHRSWVSPDGKWMLISEMDSEGWRPCRVLPFDGSNSGQTAGPKASRCTYAAWSPDGKTMYFSADAGDGYHVWRQRFPGGAPEEITFGATEEEGVAVSPDGLSLVTSAGIQESTVWCHNSRGDRQISGEGFAVVPGLGFGDRGIFSVFSPDGKELYYLVRRQGSRAFISGELWRSDLDSGRTEAVLPGVSMNVFTIGPDGKRVAYADLDAEGNPHVWIAPLDRHAPPRQLASSVAHYPYFGPKGEVFFWAHEGGRELEYSVGPDQTAPQMVVPQPSSGPGEIAPYGGKYRYVRIRDIGEMGGGKTIVIDLPAGEELPKLPLSEFMSAKDVAGLNVVAEIDMKDKTIFAPGPDPSIYAYVRATVQRNLFRIPLK